MKKALMDYTGYVADVVEPGEESTTFSLVVVVDRCG